ncbi:MAG: hypothetical protein MNPFHGCM_02958 [Gemmatimonadaceae bacterium]|nr:hypothetical protein [Gemmatimonadaceae bacterium]
MPKLGGFEVVGELTVGVLNQILQGAWDNNIIPHSTDIVAGTSFGPYSVADGVVDIPRAGVRLVMDTGVNGVKVTLASEIQVHIANPPIPGASFFDLRADVDVRVPIGVLPGTIHVAALLDTVPRASVTATLTSGDPVPALTLTAVEEYVHARYVDHTIPDHVSQPGVSFLAFTADAWVDIYDDPSKPTHRITVAQPTPAQVRLSIPVHLKLSNMSAGLSPAGVVCKLSLLADLVVAPGSLTAKISSATVEVQDFAPAPMSDAAGSYDSEGSNYSVDNAGSGGLLEGAIKSNLTARAQATAAAIGDIHVFVPTVGDIETFIADRAHETIVGRGNIGLWTPTPPPDGSVSVTDVRPLALSDAIAFCLNNPAGDTGAIHNFIPAGRSCAIAIDGNKVLEIVDEQIHRPEDEGGFGPDFPPHTFQNVDGHDAKLTRLSVSLRTGSIHVEGDVTVIDAIADSIDVDADFEAEVGLQWEDNPSGGQIVKPFLIGEPDVDLSLLAWILSFLIGFITLGIVGGIIALVVLAVVEGIAEKIGGGIIRDEITGQIKGIGAWPQTLEGIGEITTRFENPIVIDPDSILFGDEYVVHATYESVTDALANAKGPYVVPEGANVVFDGGPAKANTTYSWTFGDGAGAAQMTPTHRYSDDGLYVAKLTTVVHEDGGVTTRHFAAVRVTNVPATVDAGPPITIPEGEEIEIVATFTDPGWPDAHTAIFDFGDDSTPVVGAIAETHDAPLGRGTARARHAWCDNGDYRVTVRVIDDDGGVGVATKRVLVTNVPPSVDAGVDMFAYPCTPITLVAKFTDPGWCDTHTATWDFGDCSTPVPATVREWHEPPAGCGIAAATHRYECCGSFHAVCTVTDDDGGVGEDWLIVRVVDVKNGDFEAGFRTHASGVVANAWEPYAEESTTATAKTVRFASEEFIVRDGQRSQHVRGAGTGVAGLWQVVGANVGWDYQISCWYHLAAGHNDAVRLGIDAAGGTDPTSAAIVWATGVDSNAWRELTVRHTATARAITIFVEYAGKQGSGGAWFDSVSLLAYPCALGDPPPCTPDKPSRRCIDWRAEKRPRVIGPTFEQDGFAFRSSGGDPLRIAVWGDPAGAGKLALPRKALEVALPFTALRVVAHVLSLGQAAVRMEAFSAVHTRVGDAHSATSVDTPQALAIAAEGITSLLFTGGGGEGLLIDICIDATDGSRRVAGQETPGRRGGAPIHPETPHGERRND